MKRKIIWIPAVLLALGGVVLHCGDDKAGPGDFCEKDSDCRSGLICQNNICQEKKEGECHPPCPEGQTCVNEECHTIGNPDDKDDDTYLVADDCNDLNPEIHPGAPEYCDGVDNDCDNQTDEDCVPCPDGAVQDCGTDIGECTMGTQTCSNGNWEICGGAGPVPETCDGKDNDCDGMTDEICPCVAGDSFPCGVNQGLCTEGIQDCEDGVWTGCTGQLPQPETCEGQDNDCDGLTDEGFNIGYPCTGRGECGEGHVECKAGAELDSICDTMPGGSHDASSPEDCDGLDNDCDGLSDEELEADNAPNECMLASDLGEIRDDGSQTVLVEGNLFPGGDEDWYKIKALDDLAEDVEDNCDRFHFSVSFVDNPDSLSIDIYFDGCAEENKDCEDDTEYEHAYDWQDNSGANPIGQCPCNATNQEGATTCSSEEKIFYIRVYHPQGQIGCKHYRLSITNGVLPP